MADAPTVRVRVGMTRELRESLKEIREGQREVMAAIKENKRQGDCLVKILAGLEARVRKLEGRG